jgi:hypothetical protein
MPRLATALFSALILGALSVACSSDTAGVAPPVGVAFVSISPDTITLSRGGTRQLVATVKAANGVVLTGREIAWSTGDSSVAVVSPTGQLTAHGAGAASVTASSENHSGSASVTVVVPVTGLSIPDSTLILPIGAATSLNPEVLPADATDTRLNWASSDSSVATVSVSGRLTGERPGAATISVATLDGRFSATRVVHVGFTLKVSLRSPSGITTVNQVLAFDQNAKTYTAPGWVDKNGYWFHAAVPKQVVVLVADPTFAGFVSAPVENTDSLNIALSDSSRGSIIAESGVCFIPGLAGRLNPIKDNLERVSKINLIVDAR